VCDPGSFRGLDASRYPVWGSISRGIKESIDWARVADNPQIAFAYVKATKVRVGKTRGSRTPGGIDGFVDLNVFSGSGEQLNQL
jgi:GH25 family lysozyme M1 (1,4-beta-N-acetylmuramidase)